MRLNKFLSIAAVAVLSTSLLNALPSFAHEAIEEELTDGVFTYEFNDDNEYIIVDCDGSSSFTEIPAIVNGYSVVEIGEDALAGCTYVKELKIPDTVKTIGAGAFASCSGLTKIEFSDKLTEIPEGVLMGCANLKEAVLPESLETIGVGAFYGCSSLETLDIPDTVTTIGDYAFQRCYALKEMNIPAAVESFSETALIECPVIETITAEGNSNYKVEDNILYSSDGKTLIHAAAASVSGSVYISDNVTAISSGAFSYCSEITELFIPSSVKKIGDLAFYFCTRLRSVDFSEGLSEIGSLAFGSCTALETVEIPTTVSTLKSQVFCDNAALTKVIIPETVKTVEEGAFFACSNLKNIIIPKSIDTIGDYAFGYTFNSAGTDYAAVEGFSMSVYSGSAAEKYAKKSGFEYTTVDNSLKKVAFIVIAVGLILAAAVFAVVLMRKGKKGAPASVKKAEAEKAEEEENENYDGIVSEDE